MEMALIRPPILPVLVLLCITGLAVACHGFGGGAKKQAEKPAVEEIEKLVKDLESGVFATRAQASKRLRTIPGVLAHLRCRPKDANTPLEARRRVEQLVEELA